MRDDTLQRVVDCIAAATRYATELLRSQHRVGERAFGIDSVKRVEIIVALSEKFGLDLTARAAASPARTIADIANFIDGLLEKDGKSAKPVQDVREEESPRVRAGTIAGAVRASMPQSVPAPHYPSSAGSWQQPRGRSAAAWPW